MWPCSYRSDGRHTRLRAGLPPVRGAVNNRGMRARGRSALALAFALLWPVAVPSPAHAISVTATPVYHGVLRVARAGGKVNKQSGSAMVDVRNWSLVPAPESDGLFPDQEPVVVAIGDDNFRLEPGQLKNRGKRGFVYKARPVPSHGVKSMTLKKKRDGSWGVQFTVIGVQLY